MEHKRNIILILRFLWFFTSVPWGILPRANLVDCADNCYTSLIFSFLFFFTLGFKKLFFCSQFLLFSSLFFSALSCFLFKSVFLLFLFPITLFCLRLPYVVLLFSSYYSSFFRFLYLIPIFHLLCSSFCFL